MNIRLNRIWAALLACAMLLSFSACTAQPEEGTTPEYHPEYYPEHHPEGELLTSPPSGATFISTRQLAVNLREEFADREHAVNQEPLWNLPRDHAFYLDFEFELWSAFEVEEMFAVYIDSALTERIWANIEILWHDTDSTIPEGHSRVYIRPGLFPAGRVRGAYFDSHTFEEIRLEESGERFLHEMEDGQTWGFLRHFYLVQRVDPRSGHTLPRPMVSIFTLENQLEAPQSEFFVTEDGRAGFRWDPVEGADYYLIVRIPADMTGIAAMSPVAKVTDTYWIHPESEWGGIMNWVLSYRFVEENFSVIAVNSQTHSAVGTIHNGDEIRSLLVNVWDWETEPLAAFNVDGVLKFLLPDIGLLPTHRPLVMLNDTTVHRSIIYDFDNAEFQQWPFAFWDDEDPDGERINYWSSDTNVHIPFVIEGTAFSGVMVADADPDTYVADLAAARQRIEDAAPRGGGTTTIALTARPAPEAPELPAVEDTSEKILFRAEDRVYANSALSAFLARNMLAANTVIDLTDFPESANWDYLVDAFFEAIYQNPLILHVDGAGRVPGRNALLVQYRESAETIFAQQAAIRQIVPEIIAEIITDDMTDLDKSIAINQFLVNWAEYDWAALESAEMNDFQTVDARYNDAFTAYGILINRVGVCAGYAAAYQLLADATGLRAIVVTGYLEGTLPHAWNRVNIDGHWHTLDVTNNTNEFLFNVFLHLSDNMAGSVLIEDGRFVLDDFLAYYRSTDGSSEYFYVTGRHFSLSAIAEALALEIQQTGSATLRTDYTLDDAAFNLIAMEVMLRLNSTDLYGFHWLGVIWMADGNVWRG